MRMGLALSCALVLTALTSCSDDSADADGDGKISREERATELARDGYLAMKPGRWKMQFAFSEIDVPRLGKKEKADIISEANSGGTGVSCLSAADAAKPGADFFGGKGAEDCTYERFDLAGDRARMTLSCGMGSMGKAEMELDGTVNDVNFDFDSKLLLSVPIVGKIKLTGKLTGTHDGKCQGNE